MKRWGGATGENGLGLFFFLFLTLRKVYIVSEVFTEDLRSFKTVQLLFKSNSMCVGGEWEGVGGGRMLLFVSEGGARWGSHSAALYRQ